MELRINPDTRNHYNRSARQYPYHSHLQWLRALYGLVFCILMILFSGWRVFISPMSVQDFVAEYISVSLWAVPMSLQHANQSYRLSSSSG